MKKDFPLSTINVAGLVLVIAALYISRYHDYLLFHSLSEIFSIVIASGIFLVAWNSRHIQNNHYLLFLGIAYLFVGGIDLAHTLTYKGMMINHDHDANTPTQLWIIGRYTESLSLLIAPVFLTRPLNPMRTLSIFFVVTVGLMWSAFADVFPTCYVEGVGLTSFKIYSEYIICTILVGAFFMLWGKRNRFNRDVFILLTASIILTIGSELAFTFYIGVYDISNIVGHLLKFTSFYLIYKALVETGLKEPYELLFRDLKESEKLYRLREQEFRSMFELSAVGMAQVNPQTNRFVRVNSKFCEITGYDSAELCAMTFMNITHPDDVTLDGENYFAALRGDAEGWTTRKRYVRKDGNIIWVKVTGTIIRDVRGNPERSTAIIEDITKQKVAEEALLESEKKYRSLFTHMLNGFGYHQVVLDSDGVPVDYIFLEVNNAFEKMTGLRKEDVIGKKVTEVLPGIRNSDFDWIGEYGKVALHGSSFHTEQYARELERWYSLSAYSPEEGYFAVIFEDITRRKLAEQSLREREWQFKSTFDNAAVGIAHVSLEGQFLLVNQRFCEITGYLHDELVNKTFQEISFPDDLEADQALAGRLAAGEIPNYSLEKRYYHKDGYIVWVNLTGSLQLDDEGQPLYFIAVLEDISRRKQMENALRESEEKFKLIANSIKDVIWMSSPDCREILYVNPAYEQIWGHSISELQTGKRTFSDYIHPDDRHRINKSLARNPSAKWKDMYRIIRPGGAIRWIEDSSDPILDREGNLHLRVGVARDITERKHAELEKEEYLNQLNLLMKELERSNDDLQQFASIVSHDLQEPLRTVSSFVQLFARRYQGHIDEKADTYINFIMDGTQHMKGLLSDLLSFAKLGGGQLKLQRTDLQSVLTKVLQNLNVVMSESHAQVVSAGLPIVLADEMQMIHLFQNLVSNAIKFRREENPLLKITSEQQDKEWVICITDNGIGIDPKHYTRIFSVFQRLHHRGEYQGTGIGLAICKKIVERHRGRIWVESAPGKGSSFYFSLPAAGRER